jgi:zinc protease
VTDAELEFARNRLIQGFPGRFGTTSGVAGTLGELVVYDLPDDYFATYQAKLAAVTRDDVNRVARQYLKPDRMTILVVGDRAKVEGPLRSLPFVKVILALDPDGNPVPTGGPGAK